MRDEGPTDIWNIVSLCPRHHTLVHLKLFRIDADGKGGFRFFRTSDGAELVASPRMALGGSPEETSPPPEGEIAGGSGERLSTYGHDVVLGRLLDLAEKERGSSAA